MTDQNIILIDDEEHIRLSSSQSLELAGYEVFNYANPKEALDQISEDWDGIIISDIKMPGMDGMELMERVFARDSQLPVILITGHGDVPMAVEAMRKGAYDFIEKPFASEVLVEAARRALEKRALVRENRQLREILSGAPPIEQTIIGTSPQMKLLREKILTFSATDADVLIHGETGAGKELVARALHDFSDRQEAKFVPINCGALPDTIIESELFGHEAGSFTGANKLRIGKFEHAAGGTLFLDEIESMPLDLQIRLLRVLQDRKIVRLGSNEEIPVDVRIIAATKDDLKTKSDLGDFRQDLYYRLNVLALSIPPLKERKQDIPLLFEHFLNQSAERHKSQRVETSGEVITQLMNHDWPGNVRELQNCAIRVALGFDFEFNQNNEGSLINGATQVGTLSEQLAVHEKEIIKKALTDNDFCLKETYQALGVSRKTLYDKMQKYDLNVSELNKTTE